MEAYRTYLVDHTILTVIVFFVGRVLRQSIGAESEARRIHGRYVFWWAVGAFTIGGAVGPLVTNADLPLGAAGQAMFCLLGGWLIGTIHGAVVLAFRPPEPSAADKVSR